jgi:phosphomannomutase
VENFRELQAAMRRSPARLVVGVMNDGDGDRFVGGGREAVLVTRTGSGRWSRASWSARRG